MKKLINMMLAAAVLSVAVNSDISARVTNQNPKAPVAKKTTRSRGRGRSAATMRGKAKQVQAITTEMPKMSPAAKVEAARTANELAQDLLNDLEARTWAGDLGISKYTPAQVDAAIKKITDLEIQRTQLMRDIESKQAELDAMSTKSLIFWTKAEGGKEEAHKVASQQLAEMKNTLKNVNKALRNQAVIAGKEYAATVRMAVGALSAAALAGLTYGIDKYTGNKLGFATSVDAGYDAASKEFAVAREEGFVNYSKRRGGQAYEFGRTKMNEAYDAGRTNLSALGVSVNEKYESFKQWMSEKRAALRKLMGSDKVELKSALDAAAQNEKDIVEANKALAKDPSNSDAQDKKDLASNDLQDNINKADAIAGE